jgi:hypothetical protein
MDTANSAGFMGFFHNLMASIQNSPNPEIYYVGLVIAIIFVVMVMEKIFRVATTIFFVAIILLALGASQSGDLQGIFSSIKGAISSGGFTSENSSSPPKTSSGSYITGNGPDRSQDKKPAGAASGSPDIDSIKSIPAISNILSIINGNK